MSIMTTPYIGSKISLISKAKIRYEGYLYTICKKDSTVTLAKVISLGTEDRVPKAPIPPRDEVFEYIVFRGTDIDDLHVAEAPKSHTDPAIVHTGHAHTNGYPPISRTQMFPPNYPPFGGIPSPFGFSPFGYPNILDSQGRIRRDSLRQVSPPTAQRSPTPDEMRRSFGRSRHYSSSRDDSDIRYESRDEKNEKREDQERGRGDQERGREERDGERRTRDERGDSSRRSESRREDSKKGDFRRVDGRREERRDDRKGENERKGGRQFSRRDKQESSRREIEDGKRTISNEKRSKSEERSRNDTSRNGGDISRNGGEGSRRGNRNNQSRSFSRSNAKDKDNFKEDFDFELSNAKFNKEEIEKELLKVLKSSLKIKEDGDEVVIESTRIEDEKNEDELETLPSPDKFYDRSKSFFDNISCEAMADKEYEPTLTRRQERSLNVDTFGPAANSYRGFYRRGRGRGRGGRGRGGYRGRGRGGFSRGGMSRGGFKGGQSSRTWVDYEFDYEAAGLRNRNS